jgi:hypothetical protein
MFCEKCGANLPAGTKFCGGCGARTEAQPAVTQEQSTPSPAPPRPAVPPRTSPAAASGGAPQTALAYTPQPGAEPLSVGQYIVMLLLLCIPILNIILIFVWSFSSGRNLNKKNLARAFLIFLAVGFVLVLVGGGALMGVLESIMDGYY